MAGPRAGVALGGVLEGNAGWEGLVRGGIGEALKRAREILQNAEWGPWGSRGGRV